MIWPLGIDFTPHTDMVTALSLTEEKDLALSPAFIDACADFSTVINSLPKAVGIVLFFGALGAVVGYKVSGWSYEGLRKFAADNHEAVDLTDSYVREEDEFMHFKRGMGNRVTPSINSILPVYSAGLGALAGAFFGFTQAKAAVIGVLKREREEREVARYPV